MRKTIIILLAIGFLTGVSSCVKEKFSAPTVSNTDPDITPNTTIAAILAPFANAPAGTSGFQINANLILSAVVVADDKSGNFYKQLAIEDSTGGIMLMINAEDLYTTYPVGRRLFVQLQGLYIANYEGTYEIVASTDNNTLTGISTPNLSQYIIPGKWGISIAPKVVTIPQLTGNPYAYQSELIQLNNVEFAPGYRGVPYANALYELSSSLFIKDCNENTDTLYTSGYADFANSLTPSGNGTLVCIAGTYVTTDGALSQLMIRDTTDLNLTGPVCP